MCGICGKYNYDKTNIIDLDVIKNMLSKMDHRGPDDEGIYFSGNIALGHKRLSIIDLNTGKQPIANEDSTIWIIFNGEIYNYIELREILNRKGHIFKTKTDTEVIIHLYEEYGENFINKLNGMFSFVIWDEKKNNLLLARDRVGIKPLYYHFTEKSIVFASEIKSILCDPSVKREINYQAIDTSLTFYYVPGKQTLLKNIYKLEPGCYLICNNSKVTKKQYWDLKFNDNYIDCKIDKCGEDLSNLISKIVCDHMISDVPVGFLLSGGIDSTTLLSFAHGYTNRTINTYTIGFSGENFEDERYYAKIASNKFNTNHYEMTISHNQFWDSIPKYVWHMEEPICEPPAIALYFITKLAKEHVKVLISGEGGDEAFAGYQTYRNYVWLERIKKFLGPTNNYFSDALNYLTNNKYLFKYNRYTKAMKYNFDKYYYSRSSSPFNLFNLKYNDLYTSEFNDNIIKNTSIILLNKYFKEVSTQSILKKMLYIDTKTYLPDDLLVKADKISMANSIELRVPFLDHRMLEFAASLPDKYKLNYFTTKYILKYSIKNKIPKEIIERRKTGFPVPYESWLKNELKRKVLDLLSDNRTIQRGYFNKNIADKLYKNSGKGVYFPNELFMLISLEYWHRQFIDIKY